MRFLRLRKLIASIVYIQFYRYNEYLKSTMEVFDKNINLGNPTRRRVKSMLE